MGQYKEFQGSDYSVENLNFAMHVSVDSQASTEDRFAANEFLTRYEESQGWVYR